MKKIIFCGIRNKLEAIVLARELGYEVIGYIDNDYYIGYEQYGVKIIGTFNDLLSDKSNAITDVKDSVDFFPSKHFVSNANSLLNQTRLTVLDLLDTANVSVANLISPTVRNLDKLNVTLGKGIYLSDNVHISSNAVIKDYATIQYGAYISNEVVIGRNTTIAPYCVIGDGVTLGDNCIINISSVIARNSVLTQAPITIGDNTIIGLGLAVMTDIEPNSIILPGSNTRRVYNRLSHII